MHRIRIQFVVVWVVLALTACVVVGQGAPATPDAPADTEAAALTAPSVAPHKGHTAPDFTLQNLDGQPVNLDDLGGQVVMLNFWAVWCGFCRIEMPEIEAAYTTYHKQGFVVLGINVGERHDVVREFVEGMGLSFPILLDGDTEVTSAYEIRGLPTSLFINQDGVIYAVHVGPLDKASIERYLAQAGAQ